MLPYGVLQLGDAGSATAIDGRLNIMKTRGLPLSAELSIDGLLGMVFIVAFCAVEETRSSAETMRFRICWVFRAGAFASPVDKHDIGIVASHAILSPVEICVGDIKAYARQVNTL